MNIWKNIQPFLVDAVPHEDGIVSVSLKLVIRAGVVTPRQHESVQGDGADIFFHFPHPGWLSLETVDRQNPASPDVGNPVVVLALGGERSLHQVGVEVFVVRELLGGQVILAGLQSGNTHGGLVGEESEPLRVSPEQSNVVTVPHVRGIDPVELQSPLVAGSIPVDLGQAVYC